MKILLLIFFICALGMTTFTGCDEIHVSDISKDSVILIAPQDGIVSSGENMFWWHNLNGAEQYQLIVVSPDVANASRLVLDTTIVSNQFRVTLPQGNHEWCVRAKNSGYNTEYSCRMIEVE